MSRKTVSFGAKPPAQQPAVSADDWVAGEQPSAQRREEKSEPMKRLTIDVPASLHRRIKMQCAARETKIADEVRALLEAHFPEEMQPSNGHMATES